MGVIVSNKTVFASADDKESLCLLSNKSVKLTSCVICIIYFTRRKLVLGCHSPWPKPVPFQEQQQHRGACWRGPFLVPRDWEGKGSAGNGQEVRGIQGRGQGQTERCGGQGAGRGPGGAGWAVLGHSKVGRVLVPLLNLSPSLKMQRSSPEGGIHLTCHSCHNLFTGKPEILDWQVRGPLEGGGERPCPRGRGRGRKALGRWRFGGGALSAHAPLGLLWLSCPTGVCACLMPAWCPLSARTRSTSSAAGIAVRTSSGCEGWCPSASTASRRSCCTRRSASREWRRTFAAKVPRRGARSLPRAEVPPAAVSSGQVVACGGQGREAASALGSER